MSIEQARNEFTDEPPRWTVRLDTSMSPGTLIPATETLGVRIISTGPDHIEFTTAERQP